MFKINNKKGFTLIELIVIMAVIAILVLLAMPKFMGYTEKARLTEIKNNIKQLETASERYYIDKNNWPRLSDTKYTADQVEAFAQEIKDKTGHVVVLDPNGDYYDIDYSKLQKYVQKPKNDIHYILQNPVGEVFYLDKLTEQGKNRHDEEVQQPIPDEERPLSLSVPLYLNGDYVDFGKPILSSTNGSQPYTIEIRAKFESITTEQILLTQYIAPTSPNRLLIGQNSGKFRYFKGGVSLYGPQVIPNVEYLLSITKDSSGNVKMYVDGELVASGIDTSPFDDIKTQLGSELYYENSTGIHIKEVRIWDKARTSEEIKNTQNHLLIGTEGNLINYYDFVGTSQNVLYDKTGTTNGTIYGLNYATTSLYINGGYVDFGKPILSTTNALQPYTIEIRAKFRESSNQQILLSQYSSSTSSSRLLIGQTNGKFQYFKNVGASIVSIYGPQVVPNVEYLLSITRDGSGNLKMYVDGALVASGIDTGVFENVNTQLGESVYDYASRGIEIKEVRIWNKARTQTEILNKKSFLLNGKEANLINYYDLTNGSGNKINDKIGTTNGTIYNNATWNPIN